MYCAWKRLGKRHVAVWGKENERWLVGLAFCLDLSNDTQSVYNLLYVQVLNANYELI